MNKFLRVRKSEQFSPQKTSFMTEVLKKNHFIYLDFSDENSLKVLENSKPQSNEEVTQVIGDNQIAGLNRLSFKTYQMLHYLSDKKLVSQQRKHIDDIVRTRVKREKQRRELKETSEMKHKNRKNMENSKIQSKDFRMSLDLPEIENYLQNKESEEAQRKLVQREKKLFTSIKAAGSYKPAHAPRMKEKVNLILPTIKKLRYDKTKV